MISGYCKLWAFFIFDYGDVYEGTVGFMDVSKPRDCYMQSWFTHSPAALVHAFCRSSVVLIHCYITADRRRYVAGVSIRTIATDFNCS
jgi:hypothetical protein